MARGAKGGGPRTNGPRKQRDPKSRTIRREREKEDLEGLEKRVADLDVKATLTKFEELPLSQETADGLRDSHYENLTEIQERAIPLALKGHDLLAAAKTGSGKTLAFLVPLLEKLHRTAWDQGLGGLILAPTRELAVQIFQELRKAGRHHTLSAGLVIGGKSLKEEAERIGKMNILVSTPGRLLQHLDSSVGFDVYNLQVLVLDEADRIMDLGFQSAVDALLEHLPKTRQTLLFSATQSKKVSDLARLSLKDPEYLSVHEAADSATPAKLEQYYTVTPLPDKLDTLYSFIRSNLKRKMIVFFSSGKQVRQAYETFRQLQPGIPLLHLHGRQKQVARLEITSRFSAAKYSALFATDVVARGVDIPAVTDVVQLDCPEDADTYIHRVGRTARYDSGGRAILFLDPSEEEGMLRRLEHKKVPIKRVNVREKKRSSIQDQVQSMAWKQHNIKYLGQKAFISYTRSIHLQKDKEVFRFDELDLDGYAKSLGLAGAPQIRFQKGEDLKKLKNAPRGMLSSGSESDSGGEGSREKKKDGVVTAVDRVFGRVNQDVLSKHYTDLVVSDDEVGEDGDFFSAKRHLKAGAADGPDGETKTPDGRVVLLGGREEFVIDSKRREKLLKSKKKLLKFKEGGKKTVFDDEGNPHALYELQNEEDFKEQGPAEELRQRFVADEVDRVRVADVADKEAAKQKRKEKRAKRKARERGEDYAGEEAQAEAPEFEDGEDPLALLRSLPLPGESRSDSGGDDEDRERPRKRIKKGEVPEALEDLEAMATGLLDE